MSDLRIQSPTRGAHEQGKQSLPFAVSVAVLALGATGCGPHQTPPEPKPDGGCSSPCFYVDEGDGGRTCVCAV